MPNSGVQHSDNTLQNSCASSLKDVLGVGGSVRRRHSCGSAKQTASGTASWNAALLACASTIRACIHCSRVHGLRFKLLCRVLITQHTMRRASRAEQRFGQFKAQIAQAFEDYLSCEATHRSQHTPLPAAGSCRRGRAMRTALEAQDWWGQNPLQMDLRRRWHMTSHTLA